MTPARLTPILVTDYSLGGLPRQILQLPSDRQMRVPDEVLQCCAFILDPSPLESTPLATAFAVSVKVDDGFSYPYLITAAHVIEKCRAKAPESPVVVRLNRRDGTSGTVGIPLGMWSFHADHDRQRGVCIDVAAAPIAELWNDFSFRFLPMTMFHTRDTIVDRNVGIGDPVFITGLFTKHYGQSNNEVLGRFGHIASIPREPILVDPGPPPSFMESYLIEARSTGGISGSPVFATYDPVRLLEFVAKRTNAPIFTLLGIFHGHWGPKDADDKGKERITTGIGVVVPAYRIVELLHQSVFVEERGRVAEIRRTHRSTTPLS